MPGASPSARQFASSMRSGMESKPLRESVFEIIRQTNALPAWPGPNPPPPPIDRHYRCGLHPARFPEVSEAIPARVDLRGSIFPAHSEKIAETAHPPEPVSTAGRVPAHGRRTVALLNIIYLPTGGGSENPHRYRAARLLHASPDPCDPICSAMFPPRPRPSN